MLFTILSIASLFAFNVITPGASFVLTLQHALSYGRRAGTGVALGLSVSDVTFATLALWGVAALMKANAGLVAGIGCVGGVWLAVLGLKMFQRTRAAAQHVEATVSDREMPLTQAVRIGTSAGLVNPQAIVFFSTAFLAGVNAQPSALEGILLVGAIAVTSVLIRCGIARMVSMPDVRRMYLARKRHVETLSAAALFAFGMKLSVKAMFPWALKLITTVGFAAHFVHG